tara:strand:+ start:726 stop:899 length:174 start_codon:yes stop_codon:yes gene_type:complete
MLFKDVGQLREYAIKKALNDNFNKNYYFLEFGVWKGESANYFQTIVKNYIALIVLKD